MKNVSLLKKLLMDTPFEHLLSFLHNTKLEWCLSKDKKQKYKAIVWVEGKTVQYRGSSGNSPRSALLDALASFLSKENKDYHEYLDK